MKTYLIERVMIDAAYILLIPVFFMLQTGCSDSGYYRDTLEVTWPDADTKVALGSRIPIRWNYYGVSRVRILISRDNGSWHVLKAPAPCTGMYEWKVTDGGKALAQTCRIRIVDDDNRESTVAVSQEFIIQEKTVWHVKEGAAGGGDGLSWETAFSHPQEAMNAAAGGDEIWVAAGSYFEYDPGEPVIRFKDCVSVYGGFAGEETVRNERSRTENETMLRTEHRSSICVTGSWFGVLNGFVISEGSESCVGIANVQAYNMTVSNCVIIDNSGCGIYNETSSVKIDNCIFSNNSGIGGLVNVGDRYYNEPFPHAIENYFPLPDDRTSSQIVPYLEITNCVLTGNRGSRGGSIYSSIPMAITNCTFYNNSAEYGGAMYVTSSRDTRIINSILWDNPSNTGSGILLLHDEDNPDFISYCDIQGWFGSGNNIIDTDPLFVDPDNGDLHLQTGSPCIDAGTSRGSPFEDIESLPRDAVPDMGAYEYRE